MKGKSFQEGETVWRTILPIGHKDADLGKWSPNWEGPLIIQNIVIGGAYILKGEDGQVFKRPINGIYLKKFYPGSHCHNKKEKLF